MPNMRVITQLPTPLIDGVYDVPSLLGKDDLYSVGTKNFPSLVQFVVVRAAMTSDYAVDDNLPDDQSGMNNRVYTPVEVTHDYAVFLEPIGIASDFQTTVEDWVIKHREMKIPDVSDPATVTELKNEFVAALQGKSPEDLALSGLHPMYHLFADSDSAEIEFILKLSLMVFAVLLENRKRQVEYEKQAAAKAATPNN